MRCRSSNSLSSRVRQNSPRTPLSASNRRMLRERRTEARTKTSRHRRRRQRPCKVPASRQELPSGLARGLCVPPAQEFGASTGVCHRSDEIRPPSRRAESFATRTMKLSLTKGGTGRRRPTRQPAFCYEFQTIGNDTARRPFMVAMTLIFRTIAKPAPRGSALKKRTHGK